MYIIFQLMPRVVRDEQHFRLAALEKYEFLAVSGTHTLIQASVTTTKILVLSQLRARVSFACKPVDLFVLTSPHWLPTHPT